MSTPITYVETVMPPTEMWVEAGSLVPPGWSVVEYEPPTGFAKWTYRGKVRIRKDGGSTVHRWSPELVDLARFVGRVLSEVQPPMFVGKSHRVSPASREWSELHTEFYTGSIGFHENLIPPREGEHLEDVQARIVGGLMEASRRAQVKKCREAWREAARAVQGYQYRPKGE